MDIVSPNVINSTADKRKVGWNICYKEKIEKKFNNSVTLQHRKVDWKRIYKCIDCFSWQVLLLHTDSEEEMLVALEAGADPFHSLETNIFQRALKKGHYKFAIDCVYLKELEQDSRVRLLIKECSPRDARKCLTELMNRPQATTLLFNTFISLLTTAVFEVRKTATVDLVMKKRKEKMDLLCSKLCNDCQIYYTKAMNSFTYEILKNLHSILIENCTDESCNIEDFPLDYSILREAVQSSRENLFEACKQNNESMVQVLLTDPMLPTSAGWKTIVYLLANYRSTSKTNNRNNIISLIYNYPKFQGTFSEDKEVIEKIPGVIGG